MSILITGGSGLIGVSLTQMTVEGGERPVLFYIAPIHPILRRIDSKFKYDQGSLDHLPERLNIIRTEGIDAIFHLGGMLSIPFSEERAQSERGWKPSYSLPGMVDDFVEEFNQNRSLYL